MQALSSHKYTYKTTHSDSQYGLVRAPCSGFIRQNSELLSAGQRTTEGFKSKLKSDLKRDLIMLSFAITLWGIVLAYLLDSSQSSFNRFFNSKGFGPRFLLNAFATLIADHMKRLERETRIMQPWRLLARGNAKPEDTILLSLDGTPLSSTRQGLHGKHFFVMSLAVIAVLCDVLLVVISGVPLADAQTLIAFRGSTYLSIIILSMIIGAMVTLIIRRRSDPDMPRRPNTVANVCSYLCGSNMIRDTFSNNGIVIADWRTKDTIIKNMGATYWFGEVTGSDGVKRFVVDKESGHRRKGSDLTSLSDSRPQTAKTDVSGRSSMSSLYTNIPLK